MVGNGGIYGVGGYIYFIGDDGWQDVDVFGEEVFFDLQVIFGCQFFYVGNGFVMGEFEIVELDFVGGMG